MGELRLRNVKSMLGAVVSSVAVTPGNRASTMGYVPDQ